MMKKILCIFGTRPEAIKLAPVIRALRSRSEQVMAKVCVTGQHRQMLDQVLKLFVIQADYDLQLMTQHQSLFRVASAAIAGLEPILKSEQPDWVLLQGDTTTTAAAALAAFYAGARVGHVEAGLRSHDKWRPFPEEINRRVAGVTADLHFAPTETARQNLLREGVCPQHILVTGNTVIDALQWAAAMPFDVGGLLGNGTLADSHRLVLVTAHRRESFGAPLERICAALAELARDYRDDVRIVYPVHLNPNVQNPVRRALGGIPNVTLLPPLDYLPLVQLMKRAHLVLTDSGGIQEEAPSLGVPVLVMREVTERPEGVTAGTAVLVGTDKERIVGETRRLLDDAEAHASMARAVNPYGDGHAGGRIAAALLQEAE